MADGEANAGDLLATVAQELDADDGEVRFTVRGLYALAGVHDFDVSRRTVERWVGTLEEAGFIDGDAYEHRRGTVYAIDDELLEALCVLRREDLRPILNEQGVEWGSSEYLDLVRGLKDPDTAAETVLEFHRLYKVDEGE